MVPLSINLPLRPYLIGQQRGCCGLFQQGIKCDEGSCTVLTPEDFSHSAGELGGLDEDSASSKSSFSSLEKSLAKSAATSDLLAMPLPLLAGRN